jgi:serine/threonine protein kinase
VNLLGGKAPGTPNFSYLTRFAQIIRLLEPPPADILSRANRDIYSRLYDDQGMLKVLGTRRDIKLTLTGRFKYPDLIPGKDFTFSNLTTFLENEHDKAHFIRFAKRMLTSVPEERSTAKELLNDPWLRL